MTIFLSDLESLPIVPPGYHKLFCEKRANKVENIVNNVFLKCCKLYYYNAMLAKIP